MVRPYVVQRYSTRVAQILASTHARIVAERCRTDVPVEGKIEASATSPSSEPARTVAMEVEVENKPAAALSGTAMMKGGGEAEPAPTGEKKQIANKLTMPNIDEGEERNPAPVVTPPVNKSSDMATATGVNRSRMMGGSKTPKTDEVETAQDKLACWLGSGECEQGCCKFLWRPMRMFKYRKKTHLIIEKYAGLLN